VLNRQILKLRWWNPNEPQVIDLQWDLVPDTDLRQLVIEPSGELTTGVKVIFLEHTADLSVRTLWVLGGTRVGEELGDLQKKLFICRSMIVKERAH
jgi:alpha-mannosidase